MTTAATGQHQYACPSCGAALEFDPGNAGMVCPYCGAKTAIAAKADSQKNDYAAYAGQPHTPVTTLPAFSVACRNCGQTQQVMGIAGRCPSCKSSLVVTDDLGGQLKAPDGIVPFVITQNQAKDNFKKWSSSRWFAPNAFKKVGTTDSIRGTYLPHWGFDDKTTTDYTGRRGEHYYVTESYTENGETKTREVQHTRWYPASGRVTRAFEDVLAVGVTSPDSHTLDKLGPWSSAAATGYESEYLSGFDCPRYDVMADAGFSDAKNQMARVIEQDCRSDIGGDEQQVSSMQTYDADVLFRLLLLPLWLATYLFAGKTFHVYINANTGKVIGERPFSKAKITAAVVGALIVIGVIIAVYAKSKGHST